MTAAPATSFLEQEARALLTRLDRVRPFVVNETMVLAAAPLPTTLAAVEPFLLDGRRGLRRKVENFLRWLRGPGLEVPASEQQRRFTHIRLAFNDVLSQFDLFTEAITQRSEHLTGVWLSGLDMLATDALWVRDRLFQPPPLLCYLARGPGAAIRRARTRLPGGVSNPAALIRVPRERMIGHGIGSSLVHEVGHQGAALLSLVESLRPELLAAAAKTHGGQREAWYSWAGWISEIVADLWSVAKLGIGSTLGLIGVVSLPNWFVFRPGGTDPHPVPWIRVQLSAAIGASLYPDPQWTEVARLWSSLYPLDRAPEGMRGQLANLVAHIPEFVDTLLEHRSPALRGKRLGSVLWMPGRRRADLINTYSVWRSAPQKLFDAPPTLAFAVLGQARRDGLVSPEQESRLLGEQLTRWAVRGSLDTSLRRALPQTTAD